MEHNYKVGDKVRIKKREGYCDLYPFHFIDSMNKLAGTICEIKAIKRVAFFTNSNSKYINDDYHMYEIRPVNSSDHRDFDWSWHSSMFEPVLEDQRIQLPHLNLGMKIEIGNYVGEVKQSIPGNFYLNFDKMPKGHGGTCKEIEKLIPSFRELSRQFFPSIWKESVCDFPHFNSLSNLYMFCQALKEKLENGTSLTNFVEGTKVSIGGKIQATVFRFGTGDHYYLNLTSEAGGHTEMSKKLEIIVPEYRELARMFSPFCYKEEDCNMPIFNSLNTLYAYYKVLCDRIDNTSNVIQSITPKTLNENEIKFQRKKPSFSRGSVPKGNPICGRKHKTAIVVGHLSNQEISC